MRIPHRTNLIISVAGFTAAVFALLSCGDLKPAEKSQRGLSGKSDQQNASPVETEPTLSFTAMGAPAGTAAAQVCSCTNKSMNCQFQSAQVTTSSGSICVQGSLWGAWYANSAAITCSCSGSQANVTICNAGQQAVGICNDMTTGPTTDGGGYGWAFGNFSTQAECENKVRANCSSSCGSITGQFCVKDPTIAPVSETNRGASIEPVE
jgi:hypothetical protein